MLKQQRVLSIAAIQQQVDESCHIGNADYSIGFNIATDGTNTIIVVQQEVDQFRHVGNAHLSVVVHITQLEGMLTLEQGNFLNNTGGDTAIDVVGIAVNSPA